MKKIEKKPPPGELTVVVVIVVAVGDVVVVVVDAENVGTHGISSPFDRSGGFSGQNRNMPSIDNIEVEK